MSDEIIIRLFDDDTSVKGATVPDSDGNYNVYINARLSEAQQLKTLKHEVRHIRRGDFHNRLTIWEAEG